jgi:hypothetical protein
VASGRRAHRPADLFQIGEQTVAIHHLVADGLRGAAGIRRQEVGQRSAGLVAGRRGARTPDERQRGGEQNGVEAVADPGRVLPDPSGGGAQDDRRAELAGLERAALERAGRVAGLGEVRAAADAFVVCCERAED